MSDQFLDPAFFQYEAPLAATAEYPSPDVYPNSFVPELNPPAHNFEFFVHDSNFWVQTPDFSASGRFLNSSAQGHHSVQDLDRLTQDPMFLTKSSGSSVHGQEYSPTAVYHNSSASTNIGDDTDTSSTPRAPPTAESPRCCNRTFTERSSWVRHQREVKSCPNYTGTQQRWQCLVCATTSPRKSTVKQHVKEVHKVSEEEAKVRMRRVSRKDESHV